MRLSKAKSTKPRRPLEEQNELQVKALIASIKLGDKRAFTKLVQRYEKQVSALAYKMVHDTDEAADIVQEVFVKMARNIHKYDEKKKFYTWLYRITINTSIDYIRKHQRHRHESLDTVNYVLESADDSPEKNYNCRQIGGFIEEAASQLSDKQRSAFILRDVEGCKINDVANIMDIPEATVRWYLHRARQKIRKHLTRRCPHLLILLGLK